MTNPTKRELEDSSEAALDRVTRGDAPSRAQFLRLAGGGAAGALAIFVAACGSDDDEPLGGPTAPSGGGNGPGNVKGDLDILNYALTLEFLESEFYQQVLAAGEITDPKLVDVVKTIAENEQEHVQALKATIQKLGGNPTAKPQTAFQEVISAGRDKILETAAMVENLGAAAYLGQAPNIKSDEVLAAALSIHSVEGRHAAVLNNVVGKTIVPDGAFAEPATMEEVLMQVKPFIKS